MGLKTFGFTQSIYIKEVIPRQDTILFGKYHESSKEVLGYSPTEKQTGATFTEEFARSICNSFEQNNAANILSGKIPFYIKKGSENSCFLTLR